jgi:signal transduction histidine kinase
MSTPSGDEMDRLRSEFAVLQQERDALLRQRALLLRSLELHERDRQLLAFEIHDGIVQDMSGAVMLLESAEREATFATPAAKEAYERAVNTLRESLTEARRFIRGLIPVVLDQAGFVASLEKLVQRFTADHGLQVTLNHSVQVVHLAPAFEMILLRIVQEALNNAWRHSGAAEATVSVQQTGDSLQLSIVDAGQGFDPAQVRPTRFGLTGIKERARLLQGTAQIVSALGQGTRVEVMLPLAEAAVEE